MQFQFTDWGEEDQTTDSHGTENISIKNEIMEDASTLEYDLPASLVEQQPAPKVGPTKVSPEEVQVPKGQPCTCPNCLESPTGKALRHKCHIEGCGKEYAKTSHLRAHLGKTFFCTIQNVIAKKKNAVTRIRTWVTAATTQGPNH